MPEEELDDLFRKAASEFQPEFDPAAWVAMEKKLDASPLPPPGFWPRIGWLAALLLTMGLGFWISLERLEHKPQGQHLSSAPSVRPAAPARPSQTGRKRVAPARTETALASRPAPEAAQPAAPEGRPHKPQPRHRAPAGRRTDAGPQKTLLTQSGRFSRSSRLYPPLPAAGRQSQPQENRRKPMPPVQPATAISQQVSGGLATGGQTAREQQPAPRPDNQAGQAAAPAGQVKADSVFSRQAAAAPADSLARTAAPPADSSGMPDKKTPASWSRLTLRLLVAPDLSTVGFARPEGISTNAGIVLSYQVTPRWSLAAGVLKARKVYGARPEDYGKPGYWYNRTRPSGIEAVCRVLDIPLNIGYQLLSRERSAVMLSTGLSSYWMLSEDYDYDYRYPNGTSYTRSWGVRNQNRHLFSIYNLSGLYTHRLGPAMSWGVEPFVKVPLAGVGAGKVKLASGGVFFSLGYRFR